MLPGGAETLDAPANHRRAATRAETRRSRKSQAQKHASTRSTETRARGTVPPERASVVLPGSQPGVPAALETWPSFAEDYQHAPTTRTAPDSNCSTTAQSPSRRALALVPSRSTTTSPGPPSTTAIRAFRHPRELRHRTSQNNPDASLATRAQPALLVRKRTQYKSAAYAQLTPHIGLPPYQRPRKAETRVSPQRGDERGAHGRRRVAAARRLAVTALRWLVRADGVLAGRLAVLVRVRPVWGPQTGVPSPAASYRPPILRPARCTRWSR